MNAQSTREAGILMLNCPYCDDLEPIRYDCLYCGGFGKVPGPRFYAVDPEPPKPGMFVRWRDAALFGVLAGLPTAIFFLWALGVLR